VAPETLADWNRAKDEAFKKFIGIGIGSWVHLCRLLDYVINLLNLLQKL